MSPFPDNKWDVLESPFMRGPSGHLDHITTAFSSPRSGFDFSPRSLSETPNSFRAPGQQHFGSVPGSPHRFGEATHYAGSFGANSEPHSLQPRGSPFSTPRSDIAKQERFCHGERGYIESFRRFTSSPKLLSSKGQSFDSTPSSFTGSSRFGRNVTRSPISCDYSRQRSDLGQRLPGVADRPPGFEERRFAVRADSVRGIATRADHARGFTLAHRKAETPTARVPTKHTYQGRLSTPSYHNRVPETPGRFF